MALAEVQTVLDWWFSMSAEAKSYLLRAHGLGSCAGAEDLGSPFAEDKEALVSAVSEPGDVRFGKEPRGWSPGAAVCLGRH